MKLKVLIAPIMLVAIIVILIWVDRPAYVVVKAKYADLLVAQQKLSNIKGKNVQAEKLVAELNESLDQKNTVLNYIPVAKQDEDIVNSLNAIASSEGVAVFKIVVDEKEDATSTGVVAEVNAPFISGNTATGQNSAITPVIKLNPKSLEVSVGVIGSYEKVKSFFKKVSNLKRYNNSLSMGITKPSTDQPTVDLLQVDAILTFNYFDKNKSIIDVDSAIFSSGQFNMTVVQDIKNKLDTDISFVDAGTSGKTNPFIP